MMRKLVADSASNVKTMEGVPYAYAPLKISTSEREFVDDDNFSIRDMLDHLRAYKGKSGTACPSVSEWLDAFGDADEVFCSTITSNLSGSYNSARVAAEEYMEANPGKKVFILDSFSTGPEQEMHLEKFRELMATDMTFEEIRDEMEAYAKTTHLWFFLSSVNNLARNGRVSTAAAVATGILGIRILGRASVVGTLESMTKCRGEKKAIVELYAKMKEEGFRGGKVRIGHTCNEEAAEKLAALIRAEYPDCDIKSRCNTGLTGFYAEEGSVLAAFEG